MASDGEAGAALAGLPVDLSSRPTEAVERRRGLPWLALLAAALLHILVILSLILEWRHPVASPPPPKAIPVTVILAPPPKPTQTPAPKPPKAISFREAGPDQRTTAPPPAEKVAPEVKSPPPTPAAAETRLPKAEPMPLPPPEKPAPPEIAKPKPPKGAAKAEAPGKASKPTQARRLALFRHLNIERGERAESGDPYLNRLYQLIEQHRIFPRVIGQFGLPVEGTAVYDVVVARDGTIILIRLEHSSGASGIDRAGETMIRSAAPFPPLPSDYPDEVTIVIGLPIFPPRS